MRLIRLLAVIALLLLSVSAFAQLTTGSLTGTVTSANAGVPGATVTLTSPNLQGSRTAQTDVNGNYNFGGLPPGDYKVRFELQGLQSVVRTTKVGVSQTARLDADLKVSSVAETITVTASSPAVVETTEVQTNVTQKLVNKLPMGRTLLAAVNLAPGVSSNGPGGNTMISGAQAYDSTYYVDGAVINEVLRGQPQNLFIEDAIQETTVQTGAISAEYGRFTGGVVTAISKSGGNELSGSFRDSFEKPTWTAAGPLPYTTPQSGMQSTYEATLGGKIIQDRLWFFGSGRYFNLDLPAAFRKFTPSEPTYSYSQGIKEHRLDAKLTGQITPKHTLVGTYLTVSNKQVNNCQLGCWEQSVLQTPRSLPNTLTSLNYNGVITNNFMVEGTYAKQYFAFKGGGGMVGSPETATTIFLAAYGGVAGAPPFCNNCSSPEERNNRNGTLKGNYFLSSSTLGTHNFAVGVQDYTDIRKANNEQSGSGFDIYTYDVQSRDANGNLKLNMTGGSGAFILWWPILEQARPNNFTTRSVFANDKWDLNSRLSFNVGVRYDKNSGTNQGGFKVADDSRVSPRLGVMYDVTGNGKLRLNASYSQYASKIANGNVGDASSPAGAGSYLYWGYYGPDIVNASSQELMKQAFAWFNSVGGTANRDYLWGGLTQGIGTIIRPGGLTSPGLDEYSFGGSTAIGANGFIRADYQYRKFNNFYTSIVNTTTGKVFDPLAGIKIDQQIVENSDDFQRNYRAILLQGGYRLFGRVDLGGNWTYSKLRGNITGESSGSGPTVSSGPGYYPEFFNYARRNPIGYLGADQRNKVRAWVSYDQPTRIGAFNLSLMERYDSGTPYGANGSIYVVNNSRCPMCPKNTFGYDPYHVYSTLTGGYWFTNRDAYRTDNISATDLALSYSIPVSRAQVFVEAKAFNVFNRQNAVSVDTTVRTATTSACVQTTGANVGKRCVAFNPFTDTPVEGVNWVKGPNFGKPISPTAGTYGRVVSGSYQMPRTYRMSVGVRF